MHRLIGERGLADTWLTATDARAAYRDMVRARRFDERATALQRRGWMSGYPPLRGHEAAQVGSVHALREGDWYVPYYRSNAAQIARGVPMSDLLCFRRGYAEYHSDHDRSNFPQAVPIATQLLHAVGAAMAADYRGADHAVLVAFGDGATSEGDFHEALNFAGVFDAPVVFLCENNGWAISVPESRQTAADSVAAKADAYGIEGRQVEGTDPLAVREATTEALAAARDGHPVLLEALTYRQGPHTTADDPARYRDADPDLPDWRTADPVERFEAFCREEGVVDDALAAQTAAEADAAVRGAIQRAESVPRPEAGTMFDHVHAERSAELARQRRRVVDAAARVDRRDLEY